MLIKYFVKGAGSYSLSETSQPPWNEHRLKHVSTNYGMKSPGISCDQIIGIKTYSITEMAYMKLKMIQVIQKITKIIK